ncbi:MAG: hypothetical protein Q7U51_14005, partial [Methanoregula sp.]|nr:hypothetical protein [Methanoregula sp.]
MSELESDFKNFKCEYGPFLSQGSELADKNRKLLVLSFSTYRFQIKAESMFAKALQLKGITPIIVTNSKAKDVLKYYRLFGIDK